MADAEYFDIVDDKNRVIGRATRKECHGNPSLMHRVVHVIVLNSSGEIFLQKRSDNKDIQPGKWDTSVGGHVDSGEHYIDAAYREAQEELGIELGEIPLLYEYIQTNEIETEWVRTFGSVHDGPFRLNPGEISDGRFWRFDEIDGSDGNIFTPNFLDEYKRFKQWQKENRHILS